MSSLRKRRKTGCLTCRQRRVKCDERKPTCERCEASNIHCAGYERMRYIDVRRDRQMEGHSPQPQPQTQSRSPSDSLPPPSAAVVRPSGVLQALSPHFESEGRPLVALPNNPTPAQRPHARARGVLAYHQYLFRTVHVLFPACYFHFWRDTLCQEAWEVEYIYDTITALGSLHRASLLLVAGGSDENENENAKSRGADTKVTALQTYTMAIQGLSRRLKSKSDPPSSDIVIAVLLLLAYFECFNGNIPAAVRHYHLAKYFFLVWPDLEKKKSDSLLPIGSALRHLSFVCRVVLPLPITLFGAENSCRLHPDERRRTRSLGNDIKDGSLMAEYMHQLLDVFSAEEYVADLVWSPFVKDLDSIPMERIKTFLEEVEDWKDRYNDPSLKSVAQKYPSGLSRRDVDGLLLGMPRQQKQQHTYQSALTAALYHFCMARLMWALARIGGNDEAYELATYFHVSEVLHLSDYAEKGAIGRGPRDHDHWVFGEAVDIGFSAMLFLCGQCCPCNMWRDFIIERLRLIGREGLFNGPAFATALTVLRGFEPVSNNNTVGALHSSMLDRLGPPESRAVPLLFNEKDGRNYKLYVLGSSPGRGDPVLGDFEVVCQAHWATDEDGAMKEPFVEAFGGGDVASLGSAGQRGRPTSDWLLSQPVIGDWMDTFRGSEFDVELAIRDHVNGVRL
ncbi:hypothetical protein LTR67_011251 [Exophiala xenobiotica]